MLPERNRDAQVPRKRAWQVRALSDDSPPLSATRYVYPPFGYAVGVLGLDEWSLCWE